MHSYVTCHGSGRVLMARLLVHFITSVYLCANFVIIYCNNGKWKYPKISKLIHIKEDTCPVSCHACAILDVKSIFFIDFDYLVQVYAFVVCSQDMFLFDKITMTMTI